MAIINKGKLTLSEVVLQQSNNNWPTAQVTTTLNVIEASSNLYFTNARVYSNVIALLPTLAGSGIAIQANGQINANAVVVTFASISQFLTTSNVSEGSNLYFTNARVYSNVIAVLAGNVAIGNATIGNVIANSAVFGSGGGGSIVGANLLSATNIQANSWLGLYTSNVIEGVNQYFTNARVYSNVIALLPTLAGQNITIAANGQINSTASGSSITSTSNVAEGSNLYYTNARVLSALTGNVAIGNLVTGTSVSNSYVTAGNVTAGNIISTGTVLFGTGAGGVIAGANLLSANNIQSNIWLGLYTANVVEFNNLYFTNARVYSNVIALLPTLAGSGITIQANGQISASTGTVSLSGLTTSNLAEGTNLYYTNSRVISALSTDATIVIAANGQIRSNTSAGTVSLAGLTTANLAEGGANLYFSNARVTALIASGGTAIYRPYIATFRGNSQVTTLNLPVTPANNNFVTVIINGVTQLSNAYTLSGNVITLSGAPATNADIDVRIVEVGQNLAKDFNSRLFYGNNVANTTLISNNFTDSSILVFENGVAQVPGIDYSVNNGLLRFTTPPGSNVTVEIRELPTLNGTQTYVGGKNIEVLANGQINSNITVGQNLTISANGQISANAAVVTFASISQFLTTSNVSEGSNLYFTNARVYSNVIALLPTLAGSGIAIQANGQINATVQEQIHPFLLSLL